MLRELLTRLPPRRVEQARVVRDHLRGVVTSVLRAPNGVPETTPFPREATNMIKVVRRIYGAAPQHEQEAIVRSMMESIRIESHYWKLLDSGAVRHDLGDTLHGFAVGAARFGAGRWDEAVEIFQRLVEGPHPPFARLCLARTLTVGRSDEDAARKVLEECTRHHPEYLPARQELAALEYRTGNIPRANDLFEPIRAQVQDLSARSPACVHIAELDAEIKEALDKKLTTRPKGPAQDTYSEELVEWYWRDMFWSMNTYEWSQSAYGWLPWLYENVITEVITKVAPEIDTIIDFGCLCAEADHRLAERFPSKKFYGIDREQAAQRLNEAAYSRPNHEFICGIVDEHLPTIAKKGSTMLFHARTGTLCYPQYLRNLYAECAREGVRAIALFENNALERRNYRYWAFDDMPDALPYIQHMFIHNYERYLVEAGYRIEAVRRIPYQNLFHEDQAVASDGHVVVIATLPS